MRIIFIRHAVALNRQDWNKNDLKRPLTQKGKEIAAKTFKKAAKVLKMPSKIYTSEAVRSIQTTQILSRCFDVDFIATNKLNPDTTLGNIKELFEHNVYFIGHEPDFSQIIKDITGAAIKFVKCGIVEIEYDENIRSGILKLLIMPKIII
jgi:phosphohistidine phosphatase